MNNIQANYTQQGNVVDDDHRDCQLTWPEANNKTSGISSIELSGTMGCAGNLPDNLTHTNWKTPTNLNDPHSLPATPSPATERLVLKWNTSHRVSPEAYGILRYNAAAPYMNRAAPGLPLCKCSGRMPEQKLLFIDSVSAISAMMKDR